MSALPFFGRRRPPAQAERPSSRPSPPQSQTVPQRFVTLLSWFPLRGGEGRVSPHPRSNRHSNAQRFAFPPSPNYARTSLGRGESMALTPFQSQTESAGRTRVFRGKDARGASLQGSPPLSPHPRSNRKRTLNGSRPFPPNIPSLRSLWIGENRFCSAFYASVRWVTASPIRMGPPVTTVAIFPIRPDTSCGERPW